MHHLLRTELHRILPQQNHHLGRTFQNLLQILILHIILIKLLQKGRIKLQLHFIGQLLLMVS